MMINEQLILRIQIQNNIITNIEYKKWFLY